MTSHEGKECEVSGRASPMMLMAPARATNGARMDYPHRVCPTRTPSRKHSTISAFL